MTAFTLKELRDKRGKVVADMRALLDGATEETRDLTDEEDTRYTTMFDEQVRIGTNIDREQRQQELDRAIAERAAPKEDARRKEGGDKADAPTAMEGFRSYLRGDRNGPGTSELRALQADADVTGGFLVPPEQFVNQLIKAVDDQVFIRGLSTTFTVSNADSLGVPTLDADPADPVWTAEILTGDEDSTMAFGKRSLHPHPLAKRIKVSNTLVRRAVQPIESLVTDRLAYKFGTTQENAFLTGSGSNQPLGVFTASDNGISTSRDVSDGNTSSEIRFDGLINAKYSLKGQYWGTSVWLFHRDGLKQISKLKDGEGQYIWRQSVQEGEPDRILGRPVIMSEFAPNTFTTTLYVGILGDFSNYWIADALSMQFQRLVELYAETNQVGFIGRLETDGMPVLEEAFVRVKLG